MFPATGLTRSSRDGTPIEKFVMPSGLRIRGREANAQARGECRHGAGGAGQGKAAKRRSSRRPSAGLAGSAGRIATVSADGRTHAIVGSAIDVFSRGATLICIALGFTRGREDRGEEGRSRAAKTAEPTGCGHR